MSASKFGGVPAFATRAAAITQAKTYSDLLHEFSDPTKGPGCLQPADREWLIACAEFLRALPALVAAAERAGVPKLDAGEIADLVIDLIVNGPPDYGAEDDEAALHLYQTTVIDAVRTTIENAYYDAALAAPAGGEAGGGTHA